MGYKLVIIVSTYMNVSIFIVISDQDHLSPNIHNTTKMGSYRMYIYTTQMGSNGIYGISIQPKVGSNGMYEQV